MLITLFPLVVALISTMIGVFGKSWDEEKKGWKRLTMKGWLVVLFAVASFGVAALQARDAYQAKLAEAERERLIRALASRDIIEGLDELLQPFKLILDERGGTDFNEPIDQHMYRAIDRIKVFDSESFMKILDQLRATDCPKGLDPAGCSWAREFVIATSRADKDLRNAMSRYSSVLPNETLTLTQSVLNHKMVEILKSMLGNIEVNQEMGRADVANVTLGWLIKGPYKYSDYYIPFLTIIQSLDGKLDTAQRVSDQTWVPKSGNGNQEPQPQADPAWARIR